MTVAVDLTSDTPYTIVSSGAADGAFTAKQTLYAARLEDDMEWLDAGSGRVPGTVVVLFHRMNQYFGTEETVTRGATQWSSTPSYAVTVPSPAPFDRSEGTALIWDDFIVRYDQDGVPLAADVTLAAGYAQDRVTEFFNKLKMRNTSFYNWRAGNFNPTERMVKKIEKAMGQTTVDQILSETQPNYLGIMQEVLKSKLKDETKMVIIKLLLP